MGIQFYEAFKIEMYSLMSLCLKHLVSHGFHYAYAFRVDDEGTYASLKFPMYVKHVKTPKVLVSAHHINE